MKKKLVVLWLCILSAAVVSLFWYNAWVYALPTPVPKNYVAVERGTTIHLPPQVTATYQKPILVHFFNPDCPCSRFNIATFKALVNQYKDEISFVIVPVTDVPYNISTLQEKFGLQVPVIADAGLSKQCGVYSTPQAVIVNTDSTLYYRGNYNKSRFCTDESTNYARIAIENVLAKKQNGIISPDALQAYGCSLPKQLIK